VSQLFRDKLADVGVWYKNNRPRHPEGQQQIRFLLKMNDCLLELLAIACGDINELEGTPKRSSALWTPNSLNARGDMKKYG